MVQVARNWACASRRRTLVAPAALGLWAVAAAATAADGPDHAAASSPGQGLRGAEAARDRVAALAEPAPRVLFEPRAAAWAARTRLTHAAPGPEVDTVCGTIRGAWEGDIAAFRGVPYGAPPTGRQRWKPARPAACWRPSVFEALRNGPACVQGNKSGGPEDEDCLSLNVFVPDGRPEALPVLVWIYGGSNVEGSVASYYGIEKIVDERAHVLVAMNYRVAVFGFLALKELSVVDPRGTSGNAGITDQQLALHWVRENIRAFGGDPHRVTIIGQSSGATNVFAHMSSRSSRGLFHRAIALSGSCNITMDQATKEAQDRALFIPRTPCFNRAGGDLLHCLYSVPAETLHAAFPASYGVFAPFYDYPTDKRGMGARLSTLLHVDGVTVSMPLEEALRHGLNDVPALFQSTQAEMDVLPVPELFNLSMPGLDAFLASRFRPTYGADFVEKLYALYNETTSIAPEYTVYAVDSDTGAGCAIRAMMLAAQQGLKSPVYWGLVATQPGYVIGGRRWPWHGFDFVSASRTWQEAAQAVGASYKANSVDSRFGSKMLEQWSRLAYSGSLDPNTWTEVQFSSAGEAHGSIIQGESIRSVRDLKGDVCSFWEANGVGQNWWWIN